MLNTDRHSNKVRVSSSLFQDFFVFCCFDELWIAAQDDETRLLQELPRTAAKGCVRYSCVVHRCCSSIPFRVAGLTRTFLSDCFDNIVNHEITSALSPWPLGYLIIPFFLRPVQYDYLEQLYSRSLITNASRHQLMQRRCYPSVLPVC
jgi:hypothetical protein